MSLFDKKGISLAAGFDYQAEQPLDSRFISSTKAELQELIDGKATYKGLVTYCLEDNTLYTFNGATFEKSSKQEEENYADLTAKIDQLKIDLLGGADTNNNTLKKLADRITKEINDRTSAISSLSSSLTNSINSVNSTLSQAIEAEKNRAVARENEIEDALEQEINDRQSAITNLSTTLTGSINSVNSTLSQAIKDEANRAKGVESTLSNNINTVSTNLNSHISNKSNPHSVTAAQVGAYTKAEVDNKVDDYLPLTGGTITGALTVNGALSTNTSLNIASHQFTNANLSVLGTSKSVLSLNNQMYASQGIVFGGTASAAGLITRGICGINISGSSITKDNLYINYDYDPDGETSNTYKTNRQVILQAGSVGTDYGNNLYQYAAVRGDVLKAYSDAHYTSISVTSTISDKVSELESAVSSLSAQVASVNISFEDLGEI